MQSDPVERLESRRLLAAQIVNGELVATGTDGADSIEFRRVGTDDVQVTFWVTMSSTPVSQQVFDLDDFDSARAEGLGGDDEIWVAAGGFIPNLTFEGGDGEDFLWGGSAGETFDGGDGADSMFGNGGADTLGGPSAFVGPGDTASGGAGDDSFSLTNFSGDASVDGGGGNDVFNYLGTDGPPADLRIFGGAGNDLLAVFPGGVPVHFDGGAGRDKIVAQTFGGPNALDLRNYPTVEDAQAEAGTVIGNDLDNFIQFDFDGTAFGGLGNDTLMVDPSTGRGQLRGEDGNDTLLGSWAGSDLLDGGPGNDTLLGNGAGSERLRLAAPADTLIGGDGTDTLEGSGSSSYQSGEIFPNTLRAYLFDNAIQVAGTMSHDSIEVRVLPATNQIRITIWTTSSTPALVQTFSRMPVVAAGFNGDDEIFVAGGASLGIVNEDADFWAIGGDGDDFFYGSGGDDLLEGNAGSDDMFGNAGNDFFRADDGEPDTVNGGSGTDTADVDNQDTVINVEDQT